MTPSISYQKLRGGYYTPELISTFLARWAIRSQNDRVLEPSCGDGSMLAASANRLLDLGADPNTLSRQLHGVELDPSEATKAVARLSAMGFRSPNYAIHEGDFFEHCQRTLLGEKILTLTLTGRQLFDVAIGNPPFIRYQNFPEEHRQVAFRLMEEAGLRPNRLTNAWLPFLVVSSLLLKDDGRLAMVIPAELFQVNYAAEARRFLSEYFRRVTLVTFNELLFEDVQQEVVLLLAERNHTNNCGVRSLALKNADDLAGLALDTLDLVELKPMDHSTEKWTQYFLTAREIKLLRHLRHDKRVFQAKRVLDVDVGVVTGQNQFFVLTKAEVKEYGLEPYLVRLVGRSNHLAGTIFRGSDWQANVDAQLPSFLFLPPNVSKEELPERVRAYIKRGEDEGVDLGYKCRIRPRWYIVPSIWTPNAFMLRQVHGYPKLVLNRSEAVCTDTIHRVRFREQTPPSQIVAAFLNSMTFAFSEVTGRSYGGGVLTFEPSEIEMLPMSLEGAAKLDLDLIDGLVRQDRIDEVLDITDRVLLKDGLGLDQVQIDMLRGIWRKLRDRRIGRRGAGIAKDVPNAQFS